MDRRSRRVPNGPGLWVVVVDIRSRRLQFHAGAVLATWFMTLVIQRAEYRDTQAVHAKLDEFLHAEEQARDALTNIDKKDPEDIERHRRVERAGD